MNLQADVDAALQEGAPLAVGRAGEAWQGEAPCCFPAHLPVFAGHFPQVAIVPGIYLIEAVAGLARRLLQRPGTLTAVTHAKWPRPAAPEEPLLVRVTGRWGDAVGALSGTVTGTQGICLRCSLIIDWR